MPHSLKRLASKRARRQARTETEQALRLIPPKPAGTPAGPLTIIGPTSRANPTFDRAGRLATQLRR